MRDQVAPDVTVEGGVVVHELLDHARDIDLLSKIPFRVRSSGMTGIVTY
jgi:hypothetical protein